MTPSLTLHCPDAFNWLVEASKLTDTEIYGRTGINKRRLQHLRVGERNGQKIEMTYPEQYILEALICEK
jgi:hypothetical protein